ncbi:ATP-binding cassette domain-containing protein [Omnitrophica bacterium]|nr:ATP-binding cassette domain-containing protein [Candidatus Omnitrophota bacterium]
MKLYELKDVKRYYGSKSALDIPSLTLQKESLYIVYGPNASGKTTLLNLLAFLDKPSEGKILFHQPKRVNYDKANRAVTMVMQDPYLFKTTVLKNIISGLIFRSINKDKARDAAEPVMRRLGIWELRNRGVASLSGGERKKVALARAIVLDADILLLDEPTSHIDRASAVLIEDMIRSITRDGKKSLIMTTHDLAEAHRLAPNIIYLVNGRRGEKPLWNIFSTNLSGTDNVKKAQLNHGTEIYVATGRSGPAKIVIDPKDIIVSRRPFASSALNNLKSKIVGVSDVNGLADLRVEAGVRLHVHITHRSFRDMRLGIGDEVFITFKASAVEVFDA